MTTDAIYRETKAKLEARKNEGCLAVEMELAGVQAVCNFYEWNLYDFLATGDVLDQAVYDESVERLTLFFCTFYTMCSSQKSYSY